MQRKTYYQYYTNVTYSTCPACLAWHGKIGKSPDAFPDRQDGCERQIRCFNKKELDYHREQERLMRQLAKDELTRRALFAEATDAVGMDNEKAIELFTQAARIDLYIPDVVRLAEGQETILKKDDTLRERLGKLFTRAYSDKFGWPRYERLAEPMRIARERAGISRIRELFS